MDIANYFKGLIQLLSGAKQIIKYYNNIANNNIH